MVVLQRERELQNFVVWNQRERELPMLQAVLQIKELQQQVEEHQREEH